MATDKNFDDFIKKSHILCADQSISKFTKRYCSVFAERGYKMVYAANAKEAIYNVNKIKPNLIILGEFEEMSSLDFGKRLKLYNEFDSTPIIFLSSSKDSKYVVDCFKAGAADFVNLNCETEELVLRVENQMKLLYFINKNKEQVKNVIKMQTDITRQSQEVMILNEQLEEQTESLKDLNSQKNRLFSLISHDLRGPLYGMNSLIETLHTYYDKLNDEDRKRKIMLLGKEGSNVFKLMESLLLWAEIQLGEFEVFSQNEKISVIINNAVFPMKKRAERKDIELFVDIKNDDIVSCDLTMIHTVVQKLLSNSVKFTERGGKIKVIVSQNENKSVIKIVDSGVGIPDNNITQLFSMSSKMSTRGTENEKGTGLGLQICQAILNLHSQELKVYSVVGEGSVFSFMLPICKD